MVWVWVRALRAVRRHAMMASSYPCPTGYVLLVLLPLVTECLAHDASRHPCSRTLPPPLPVCARRDPSGRFDAPASGGVDTSRQARDASGSTAVVALVTPTHAIIANAGDSRAVLVTAASPPNGKNASPGAANPGVGGGGGVAPSPSRSSRTPREDYGGTGGAGEDGVVVGLESPAGDTAALNDSVRLEEEEGEEESDVGDGDGEALLGVGLSEGDDAGDEAGGREGDGGGRRAGEEGRAAVRALSKDHTAADEGERERVEAAGGRTFPVNFTDDHGASSTVRASACLRRRRPL